MTFAQVAAMGPRAVALYAVGFLVGVGLFLLFGKWLSARTASWHPLTRWLVLGLLSLTMAVIAQAGIIEPVAQWTHETLNLDGKH